MHARLILACALAIAAGCSSHEATPIPAWNGKLNDRIPGPVREALEQATEFELLSLNPKHRDADAPSNFLRRQVIGKTLVSDQEIRRQILGALDFGARVPEGRGAAACFDPRHAIRVAHAGQTFYLSICFECGHVYVFVDDREDRSQYFLITAAPLPVFNEVLQAANIQLAEPAELQDELEKKPKDE
jgi:hypothetical protein